MVSYIFGAATFGSKRLLKFLLPLLLVVFAGPASAFSALYAFGDSLTDTGNVFALTAGANPGSPYFNGRFSNGPVWIETLASNLGLSINPSLLGGTNYAFGGAVTGPTLTSATPTLTQQLGLYNTAHASLADPNALYVVWGGGNDVRALGNPIGAMGNAVTNVEAIISTLAGEGAKNFLVANLPDVGLTPDAIAGGPAVQAIVSGLSTSFNNQLGTDLPGLASGLGVNISELDVYSFLNGVIANPGAYGLTNVNSRCYTGPTTGGGTVCATPNQYLFWDGIHPTAVAHAALGAYATSLVPVPPAWLFFSALSALGIVRRKAA